MKTQTSVSNLVFYLLEDDVCVGDEPVHQYAADYQELVLDEQTPRFRSSALSPGALGLEVGFTLTARRKDGFFESVGSAEDTPALQSDVIARREAELLRDWCAASERPLLAYQIEFSADSTLRRTDDVELLWENATVQQQRAVLGESAAFVVRWLLQDRPLELGEEETRVLSELLAATSANLPFYIHVFEQLVTGAREISGLPEAQHIRLGDYASKMFLRFPSYLLRRCLPRESQAELARRSSYMDCLSAAFRYNLAPISLDEFCDYLSAKADCDPRARVDLAWFIGELSRSGRGSQYLPALSA